MIQVVNRAFDIIEFIAAEPNKAHSLSEIADGLKLNHATCANILKTMVQRNYIEQLGHKKGYRLGLMLYRLAGSSSYEQELVKCSAAELEKLTKRFNETTLLAVLKKDLRVVVHQVQANNDLMVKSALEKAAYNSASGRVLVAMLDDRQQEDFVEKYGLPSLDFWEEASTARAFKAEIQKIRKRGYATQTTRTHIAGVAVPVLRNKETVASLSIYLPESRFSESVFREVIVHLRKSADAIGKKLSRKKSAR